MPHSPLVLRSYSSCPLVPLMVLEEGNGHEKTQFSLFVSFRLAAISAPPYPTVPLPVLLPLPAWRLQDRPEGDRTTEHSYTAEHPVPILRWQRAPGYTTAPLRGAESRLQEVPWCRPVMHWPGRGWFTASAEWHNVVCRDLDSRGLIAVRAWTHGRDGQGQDRTASCPLSCRPRPPQHRIRANHSKGRDAKRLAYVTTFVSIRLQGVLYGLLGACLFTRLYFITIC
jgi:hypothetical protein